MLDYESDWWSEGLVSYIPFVAFPILVANGYEVSWCVPTCLVVRFVLVPNEGDSLHQMIVLCFVRFEIRRMWTFGRGFHILVLLNVDA